MATMEIMSDGAGSPLGQALTPEELMTLKRMFGMAPRLGMTRDASSDVAPGPDDPSLTAIPTRPYSEMTLHRPRQSTQGNPAERFSSELDAAEQAQTAATLAQYGVNPSLFLPTYKPANLPTERLGAMEPRQMGNGEMQALDAGFERTVPGSAPRSMGAEGADPFGMRVAAAHDKISNSHEAQKRFFDLASKETTDTIMRAVEDKKMDTATALAILNVRARLGEEEKAVRAEDVVAKRPVRSPRQARDEALFRVFASNANGNNPNEMDPNPYQTE